MYLIGEPVFSLRHKTSEGLSMMLLFAPMLGAIGFSMLYLLLGGGLGGALLIFIVAKMFGK